jgi:hypothetical protein
MCGGLVNIAERCDFSHRRVKRGHFTVTGLYVEVKKTFPVLLSLLRGTADAHLLIHMTTARHHGRRFRSRTTPDFFFPPPSL